TLTIGARQFVVQLAFEMHLCSGVKRLSFTPSTQVRSGLSLAGADRTTLRAPAVRWLSYPGLPSFSRAVKNPVDSTATSTPSAFQGRFRGSFSAWIRMRLSFTTRLSLVNSTFPLNRP